MKKRIADLFKNRKIAAGVTAIVLAVAVGSTAVVQQRSQVPDLPSYTDPVMETTIEEEETPLASQPKVNTKTSKKTSTKKVTMKKASAKTYTKSLPQTSTTSKKTANQGNATVVTQTTAVKAVTEKYTKKSKVKVVTTTTTTTVTTTTTAKVSTASASANSSTPVNYTAEITQIAPNADSRVLTAYRTLGFTVDVNSSVAYAGYFDARTRKITLKKADDTIYHELGHFIAFIAGNVDKSSEFTAIYNQEKALFTGYNKAYATQNSSEYFAESVRDYTVNPTALKSARPKTYEAVKDAIEKFTDDRITRVQKVYGAIWK